MATLTRPRRLLLSLAAASSLVAAVLVAVKRRRVSDRVREYTSRVRSAGRSLPGEQYDPEAVADLPAPVRRYVETVLPAGQPHVEQVKLSQTGTFRLGDRETPWRPFTASQVYTVSPPAYVWDARITVLPPVTARVVDAYVSGSGLLRANLLGVIPVASAGPDPQMNEAELQRYLSETPWFPTALLPAAGVSWEGIDDWTARATIDDGHNSATAVFHFDDDGYLTRVTADRYRQDIDAVAPWTGRYWDYEERDGMQIPTRAEVAWETADGEEPYWRGRITDVDYRTR